MTGRTPTRVGVRNWIPQDSPVHLRQSEITDRHAAQAGGLRDLPRRQVAPERRVQRADAAAAGDHGFDHWFSTQNNALPSHRNPDNFVRNGQPVGKLEGYSVAPRRRRGGPLARRGRDKAKPFFLYVCFHEPHEPIASDEKYAKLYPLDDPSYTAHHGNITQMDDAFGRLMRSARRAEACAKTRSSCSPATTARRSRPAPARLGRPAARQEGLALRRRHPRAGHRPLAGQDEAGQRERRAGLRRGFPADRLRHHGHRAAARPRARRRELPAGACRRQQCSGRRRCTGTSTGGRRPKVALRVGDWKILATLDKPGRRAATTSPSRKSATSRQPSWLSSRSTTCESDIGETTDLAANEPAKLAELKALLERKYHEVRDESPTWPAWKFTNAEGQRIEWPDYVKNRARQ